MKVLKIIGVGVFIFTGIFYFSCAPATKVVPQPPDWYPNPPQDPNFLFAVATATSRDLQLASEKAKQDCRVDLASQLEANVSGLIKKFDEEVGRTEDSELLGLYTQVSKTVVDQTLVGARVKKLKVYKEGDLYRVYVLMELPLGFMKEMLLNQVKKQEALYTRFRASQAFRELEKEVQELRKMRKEEEMKYMEFEKKEGGGE